MGAILYLKAPGARRHLRVSLVWRRSIHHWAQVWWVSEFPEAQTEVLNQYLAEWGRLVVNLCSWHVEERSLIPLEKVRAGLWEV
jgi:hypothetical protein